MDASVSQHDQLGAEDRLSLRQHLDSDGSEWRDLDSPGPYANSEDLQLLEAWVWGLEMWGREPLARAALAALERALSSWADVDPTDEIVAAAREGNVPSPESIHAAVQSWLATPSVEAAVKADALLATLPDLDLNLPEFSYLAQSMSAWTLLAAANTVTVTNHPDPRPFAARAVLCATRAAITSGGSVGDIRTHIHGQLTSWLDATGPDQG